MCVTVTSTTRDEWGTSLRKGCSCRPANRPSLVVPAPVGHKDLKAQLQETHLWRHLGYPGHLKETFGAPYMSVHFLAARRCTFEHCTSCCPSLRHGIGNSDEKTEERQPKMPLTISWKGSFDGRLQNRWQNDLLVRTVVWRRIATQFPISVSNRCKHHLPPPPPSPPLPLPPLPSPLI